MANEPGRLSVSPADWQTKQVYAMAAVCLVVGLAVGYLMRGSGGAPAGATIQSSKSEPAHPHGKMPSLEEMKRMADKQAEPLLAQLKANPNSFPCLSRSEMSISRHTSFGKPPTITRSLSRSIQKT